MATQESDQRAALAAKRSARTLTVLVDAHRRQDRRSARSAADAPEIDGTVRIANGATLAVGEFARVRITGAAEHDLDARVATA